MSESSSRSAASTISAHQLTDYQDDDQAERNAHQQPADLEIADESELSHAAGPRFRRTDAQQNGTQAFANRGSDDLLTTTNSSSMA